MVRSVEHYAQPAGQLTFTRFEGLQTPWYMMNVALHLKQIPLKPVSQFSKPLAVRSAGNNGTQVLVSESL